MEKKVEVTEYIIESSEKQIQINTLLAVLRRRNSISLENDITLNNIYKSLSLPNYIWDRTCVIFFKLMITLLFLFCLCIVGSVFIEYHIMGIIVFTLLILELVSQIVNIIYHKRFMTWEDVPDYQFDDYFGSRFNLPTNEETFSRNEMLKAIKQIKDYDKLSDKPYFHDDIFDYTKSLAMVWVVYNRKKKNANFMPDVIRIDDEDYYDLIIQVNNNNHIMSSIKEHDRQFYNWVERQAELIDR
ncbi:hypothetical protein [Liquorilactobacillus mali]|uniref:Uncharacterized protein n=1 Tax=Liquorilactobacillus mali KCTC 3596 = DSM 20444 TaxID=1046596 RepID=A0A0R2E9X7_9LACO|nr:hypothetical protein [Liquorilactobacillus mali]KRN09386.1 hypothetical protein FD00_GL001109 [Liquorilactobacillus mali KCTC 3596 = DSM 20444]